MISGRLSKPGVIRLLSRRLHDEISASDSSSSSSSTSAGEEMPKPSKIYRRLSALGRTGGTVSETLKEYIREGRKLSKVEMIKCMKELRKYGHYQNALELSEWLEKQNAFYSAYDYVLRLDLISKAQGVDAAESYFRDLPKSAKRMSAYGTMLNCYCQNGLEEKALSFFKEMEELHFATSTLCFNNMMSLFIKVGKPEKIPGLVQEMKLRGTPLDTFTYNIWMSGYGRMDDIEGMENVWNELVNSDPTLCDWTVYSNLAQNYVRAGLYPQAEAALAKLESVMKPNNVEPYHFLISLYAGAGNLKEVNRIWRSLKISFPSPLNRSYSIMFAALRRLGDTELLKYFREWLSTTTWYDPRLANSVLNSYLDDGKYKEALSVFDGAIYKAGGHFCKAREVFMVYFLKEGKVNLALDHLATAVTDSEKEGWTPQSVTLHAFLNHFEEQKDVDSAEAFYNILKHMESDGKFAHQALLQAYAAAGKSLPEL